MNQIVIGATGPYLISACIYLVSKTRASRALLIVAPLSMAACAIWAILPDIPRLIGMDSLYRRLAGDPPDVTIAPRVGHIGLLDFDCAEELIKCGEDAVERSMPFLQDALAILRA